MTVQMLVRRGGSASIVFAERIRFAKIRNSVEAANRFVGEEIDIGLVAEFVEHALGRVFRAAGHDRMVAQHVPIPAQQGDSPGAFEGHADAVRHHEEGSCRHRGSPTRILTN